MSEIAEELMRRSSPGYVKDRAKEAALKRSVEVKDRVAESPLAWKVIGGALGVGLASLLSRRYQRVELEDEVLDDYRWRASPDVYVGGYTEVVPVEAVAVMDCGCDLGAHDVGMHDDQKHGVKAKVSGAAANLRDRASGAASRVSEKASDLKDRAASRVHDLREGARDSGASARERASDVAHSARERLSSAKDSARERLSSAKDSVRDRASNLRERAPELKDRAQETWHREVEEQPWAIALGAVALGALASFLLPLSETERRAFRPYREKAMGRVQGLKEEAVSRLETLKEGVTEQAKQALHGQQGEQDAGAQAGGSAGFEASANLGAEDTHAASFRVSGSAEGGVQFQGAPRDTSLNYEASQPRDEAYRSPGLIEHREGEAREAGSEVIGSYDPKVH